MRNKAVLRNIIGISQRYNTNSQVWMGVDWTVSNKMILLECPNLVDLSSILNNPQKMAT